MPVKTIALPSLHMVHVRPWIAGTWDAIYLALVS